MCEYGETYVAAHVVYVSQSMGSSQRLQFDHEVNCYQTERDRVVSCNLSRGTAEERTSPAIHRLIIVYSVFFSYTVSGGAPARACECDSVLGGGGVCVCVCVCVCARAPVSVLVCV